MGRPYPISISQPHFAAPQMRPTDLRLHRSPEPWEASFLNQRSPYDFPNDDELLADLISPKLRPRQAGPTQRHLPSAPMGADRTNSLRSSLRPAFFSRPNSNGPGQGKTVRFVAPGNTSRTDIADRITPATRASSASAFARPPATRANAASTFDRQQAEMSARAKNILWANAARRLPASTAPSTQQTGSGLNSAGDFARRVAGTTAKPRSHNFGHCPAVQPVAVHPIEIEYRAAKARQQLADARARYSMGQNFGPTSAHNGKRVLRTRAAQAIFVPSISRQKAYALPNLCSQHRW